MFCLEVSTDLAWAEAARKSLDALLVDHAHCELKAATNALSLVGRFGDEPSVARKLAELAEEEAGHFRRMLEVLEARGLSLGPPPVDEYAAALRRRALAIPWPGTKARTSLRERTVALIDRLLVAAVIEARSSERFKVILGVLGDEHELTPLYRELFASEARHYREFVDLASSLSDDKELVRERLEAFAAIEAEVVSAIAERTLDGGDGERLGEARDRALPRGNPSDRARVHG